MDHARLVSPAAVSDSGTAPCCMLYRWLMVSLIFLSVLVLFLHRLNLSVAIIPWAEQCNWDEDEQQMALGAFFYGYVVTMFPGALLSTRYSMHNEMLVLILVLSSVSSGITPTVAGCSAPLAAALRCAMGAAQGPLFPCIAGLFGNWVKPQEYSRANAFVCEGSNLGVLVAFPATSIICRYVGWQSAFTLPALAAVPCCALLILLGSSTPAKNRFLARQELLELTAAQNLVEPPKNAPSVAWGALLSSSYLWVLVLNWFCLNWCFWVLLTELPKYLSHLGFDLTSAGFLSDLPSVCNTVGALLTALIADWLIASGSMSVHNTRRLMNGVGALGTFACFIAVPLTANKHLIIGLLAVSQLFSSFTNSGVFSNVFDVAPRLAAVIMGIANGIGMTQGVLSPLLTAQLVGDDDDDADSASGSSSRNGPAHTGGWWKVWAVAAALALIAAVSFHYGSTGKNLESEWTRDESAEGSSGPSRVDARQRASIQDADRSESWR